jgi:predicted ATPase
VLDNLSEADEDSLDLLLHLMEKLEAQRARA